MDWTPAPARIHHHLDNVTDYYASGTNGWEFAHQKRIERTEREIGRISAGQWPPRRPWKRQIVVRKDVDFEAEMKAKGTQGDKKEKLANEREEVVQDAVQRNSVTRRGEERKDSLLTPRK